MTPLRKRRLSGERYERDPKIEALIAELAILSRDALIARAAITKRSDPGYVPSECLVYFIRASRHDNNETWFERLYRILTAAGTRWGATRASAIGISTGARVAARTHDRDQQARGILSAGILRLRLFAARQHRRKQGRPAIAISKQFYRREDEPST